MIDQQTIDRIIDAADIVDVVSDYVTLKRAGASYKGLCPFHDDKTPSFSVNPARGICKCFACGKGGNAVSFIMEMEQMTWVEALRHLAAKYHIEIKEDKPTDEELKNRGEREKMLAANKWAADFFRSNLLNTREGQSIGLAYFRGRGFRDDIMEKFQLGYAPDAWDTLSKEAQKKGFTNEILIKTSLAYKRENGSMVDKFRARVMFPWFSLSGQVVAFGGRLLDSRTKGVSQKYVNSNDSEIYHKSRELYGLFQAKRAIAKEQMVYMVEGYTDVLSMHQCGVENVVANSGTALNEAQIILLKRFTPNITLVYDSDEAGVHAALRSMDMLLAHDMNVKILQMPEGEDPDSYARSHSADDFRKYVKQNETDFIIFKIHKLYNPASNDVRQRTDAIDSILQSISVISRELERSNYIHECAQLMRLDENMLLRRCIELRKSGIEQKLREQERERLRQENLERRQQEGEPNTANTSAADAPPTVPTAPTAPTVPTTPTAPTTPTKVATTDKDTSDIMGMETLIMRMIVRYGEKHIFTEDVEGNQLELPVAQFVVNELQTDDMWFVTPLYVNMMTDIMPLLDGEGFSCSRHFLNSPDPAVSNFAADMLNDKYHVDSTMKLESEEDTADVIISRLVLDYKYYVVKRELNKMKQQLAKPQVIADPAAMMEIMKKMKSYTEAQRRLAVLLGDRILSK